MAHAQAENWAAVGGKSFNHVWKLTQTMKAAGWTHVASSDGYAVSLVAGTDKWVGIVQNTTTTNAQFTQPAVGSTVSVTVLSTAWMANGEVLYVAHANGGIYTVSSITNLTTVVLTNTGAAGNGAPASTIATSSQVYTMCPGAWWLGQGPTTWKIPFIAAVTGTFIRGENITQTNSSATGEVIGVVWDNSSSGYLVVMPRTGTFTNTDVITGGFSGATVTPNGTIATYVRQVVFWYDGTIATTPIRGHLYYQCVDAAAGSSELVEQFSYSNRLNAATATVCPGGASLTGANGFPGNTIGTTGYGTYVVFGTGGSNAAGTGSSAWGCVGLTPTYTNAQILCANATPSSGVSADGSFICAMSVNAVNSGAHVGFAFQRCDNNEDGDVDPYVWFAPNSTAYGSGSRTASTGTLSGAGGNEQFYYSSISLGVYLWNRHGAYCGWKGWRRRGLSGEAYVDLAACMLGYDNGGQGGATPVLALGQIPADADKVASAAVTTWTREPLWLISGSYSLSSGNKMRKGTPRWIYLTNGNNGTDTYDTKKWIQFANSGGIYGALAFVGGPADGSTVPSST